MENYQFERVNDQIRATRIDDETTVTLDADLVDVNETEGRWEQAIQALAAERLEAITHENRKFTLPYPEAVMSLVEDTTESEIVLSERDQAEALLAYFHREGILKVDGESVHLLSDSTDDLDSRMMLNAVILLELACDELSECIDAVADAKEQLSGKIEFNGVLTERTLQRVEDCIEKMEATEVALSQKASELRTSVLANQQLPSTVVTSLPQTWLHTRLLSLRPDRDRPKLLMIYVLEGFDLHALSTGLADVGGTETEVEETRPAEIAELVDEITEDVSSAVSTAREAETVDETPLQMSSSDSESQSNDDQPELSMGGTETGTEATGPLNLTPIVKTEQPSSTIKIGEKLVGKETQLVALSHKRTDAYFYVDPVEQSVVDEIGTKVKLHRNIAQLFDGIDRGADFLVDPDISIGEIKPCRAVTISTNEAEQDELERYLRETDYLLHPIQEVVPQGDVLVTFDVVEMEPTGHTTLRVTDSTEIEFTANPLGHE